MSPSRLTRPSPGLGIAPSALLVSLMTEEPVHRLPPIRSARRRFLRRRQSS
jgi:hypothetical protein